MVEQVRRREHNRFLRVGAMSSASAADPGGSLPLRGTGPRVPGWPVGRRGRGRHPSQSDCVSVGLGVAAFRRSNASAVVLCKERVGPAGGSITPVGSARAWSHRVGAVSAATESEMLSPLFARSGRLVWRDKGGPKTRKVN